MPAKDAGSKLAKKAGNTIPSLVMLRSFVNELDSSEREEFDLIVKELGQEYPQLPVIQRGQMAVAFMLQSRLLGRAFNATKNESDQLTPDEKMLLDWSRRTYDSLVNSVIASEKGADTATPFGKILEGFLKEREQKKGDFQVERKFKKISLADVEAEAMRKGISKESLGPLPSRKTAESPIEEENNFSPKKKGGGLDGHVVF